jgi:hypothetical protein
MRGHKYLVALVLSCLFPLTADAREELTTIKEDSRHVSTWNAFADDLYALHERLVNRYVIHTTEETGGYGGFAFKYPEFFREVRYFRKKDDRLLSRIRWETEQPENIHTIEVFIHDSENRVIRDYLAAWLPNHRNAPVQTLINLHNYNGRLHAYRQFDASGERIYEQCTGSLDGRPVEIHLEDHQLPSQGQYRPEIMSSGVYSSCFGGLPVKADKYLDPLNEVKRAERVANLLTPAVSYRD